VSAVNDRHDAPALYGLLAEFADVRDLLRAAEAVRDAGYRRWDSFAPFAVHGINEAMGLRPSRLPWIVFGGGLAGTLAALALQWWTNAVDYPFLISGKPLFGLPAAIPVAFELTILFAAFAAFFGMFAANRLPELSHPLFARARFRRATTDRFFIVIEAADPRFDPVRTRELLEGLSPVAVEEVPAC